MRINKNIYSLNVFRNYSNNIAKNSAAMDRISSGKKLNSAKDNPIKLEKSEKFKMQIKALQVAERNLQDGVSMIQTADTAMTTISEALIRIKELAVQVGNSTYTKEDREGVQKEVDELISFIGNTVKDTEFNGNKLLDDSGNQGAVIKMQTGANVGDVIEIPVLNLSLKDLGIDDLSVLSVDEISKSLEAIDSAIVRVNSSRSAYGAIQNRMETSIETVESGKLSFEKGYSDIVDSDLAFEMTEVAKTSVLIESATAIMAQTNNFPKDVLNILANVIK